MSLQFKHSIKDAKYKYKLAIRSKRGETAERFTDTLCESLLKKNNSFWNVWNSRFKKRQCLPANVGGLTDPREIADGFACYLSNICKPSLKKNSTAADGLREALYKYPELKAYACETISVSQLDNIIFNMKRQG